MTSRRYAFTAWSKPEPNACYFRYMCYGEEICPKTGKIHFQGYLELYSPARIVTVKKYLKDNSAHFEKAKGTKEQNILYCKKDGKFHEFDKKGLEIVLPQVPDTECHACVRLPLGEGSVYIRCKNHRLCTKQESCNLYDMLEL